MYIPPFFLTPAFVLVHSDDGLARVSPIWQVYYVVRLYQLASDVSGVCSLVRPMLKGCRAMVKGVLSVEHTPGACPLLHYRGGNSWASPILSADPWNKRSFNLIGCRDWDICSSTFLLQIYFLLEATLLISSYFSAIFAINSFIVFQRISKISEVWIVDRHASSIAPRHIVPITPSRDKFPEWVTAIDLSFEKWKGEGGSRRKDETRSGEATETRDTPRRNRDCLFLSRGLETGSPTRTLLSDAPSLFPVHRR